MNVYFIVAEISEGNEAVECHCLVSSGIASQSEDVPLGDYVIEWKRFEFCYYKFSMFVSKRGEIYEVYHRSGFPDGFAWELSVLS